MAVQCWRCVPWASTDDLRPLLQIRTTDNPSFVRVMLDNGSALVEVAFQHQERLRKQTDSTIAVCLLKKFMCDEGGDLGEMVGVSSCDDVVAEVRGSLSRDRQRAKWGRRALRQAGTLEPS